MHERSGSCIASQDLELDFASLLHYLRDAKEEDCWLDAELYQIYDCPMQQVPASATVSQRGLANQVSLMFVRSSRLLVHFLRVYSQTWLKALIHIWSWTNSGQGS